MIPAAPRCEKCGTRLRRSGACPTCDARQEQRQALSPLLDQQRDHIERDYPRHE